jgi:hypothetical protein
VTLSVKRWYSSLVIKVQAGASSARSDWLALWASGGYEGRMEQLENDIPTVAHEFTQTTCAVVSVAVFGRHLAASFSGLTRLDRHVLGSAHWQQSRCECGARAWFWVQCQQRNSISGRIGTFWITSLDGLWWNWRGESAGF